MPVLNPAQIMQELLVTHSQASRPLDEGAWPCFVSTLPNTPDECIAVYNSGASRDGRDARTKATLWHPRVQIRVRALSYQDAVDKIDEIVAELETIQMEWIQPDSNDYVYQIQTVSVTASPVELPVGDNNDRTDFAATFQMSVAKSSTISSASPFELVVQKGLAGGYAPLDDSGKVPAIHLPAGQGGGVSSVNDLTGVVTLIPSSIGAAAAAHTHVVADVSGLQDTLDVLDTDLNSVANDIVTLADSFDAAKGQPNGYAGLDGNGLLLPSVLPPIAISEKLTSVASQIEMLALEGQSGDWTIRTDLGSVWIITGDDPTQLSDWTQLEYPAAPVMSVAGRTGDVSLSNTDIAGLGSAALSDVGDFAAAGHNHDGVYSPVAHNHDGVYSPVAHNHDGVYEPARTQVSGGEITDGTGSTIRAYTPADVKSFVETHAPSGTVPDLSISEGKLTADLLQNINAALRFSSTGIGGIPIAGEYIDQSYSPVNNTNLGSVADRIELYPFLSAIDFDIDQIGVAVAIAGGNLAKIVMYASGSDGNPTTIIYEGGDLTLTPTGLKVEAMSHTFMKGVRYWLGIRISATGASMRGVPLTGQKPLGTVTGDGTGSTYDTALRRTLAYASPAPSPWNFVVTDRVNAVQYAIRMRVS
jgi:hypothetical protein